MTEENQVPENTENAREKITPDSLKNTEEGGNRSPIKTECDDLSNKPQENAESSAPEQTGTVRELVVPTADGNSIFSDDDRSPGRTEK